MKRLTWMFILFFAFTGLGSLAASAQRIYVYRPAPPYYGYRAYHPVPHYYHSGYYYRPAFYGPAYYRHERWERRRFYRHELRERRAFIRHERRERWEHRHGWR